MPGEKGWLLTLAHGHGHDDADQQDGEDDQGDYPV